MAELIDPNIQKSPQYFPQFPWHEFDADSADPTTCLPDETPLVCEYRVVRPAVALIMLGTNDVLTMSTTRYEEFMRRVIENHLASPGRKLRRAAGLFEVQKDAKGRKVVVMIIKPRIEN